VSGTLAALCALVLISFGNVFLIAFFGLAVLPVGFGVGGVLGRNVGVRFARHFCSSWSLRSQASALAMTLLSSSGVVVGLAGLLSWSLSPPSDAGMFRHFSRREAAFEQLARMAEEDPQVWRIGSNFTDPDNRAELGLSDQRIAQYRALLRQAGVRVVIHRREPNYIVFSYWDFGSAISESDSKGFAYSTERLEPIVPSLDFRKGYRRIHGHWYLYYE
jgi:hypothetical protein